MAIKEGYTGFILITSILFCSVTGRGENHQAQSVKLDRQQEISGPARTQNKKNNQPKTIEESQNQSERPQEIVLFIADVRSAPPEFTIDLLLRLAESNRIADPAWKCELIEEAFRLAPTVQQPIKRVWLPSVPTDTRSGFLSQAFELNLDALSLQCRAVRAMLTVDKKKARQLFGEIPKLELYPAECEDALVYDVSDFYVTLKMIAETTFSQEEIKNNEPARLIEFYIGQIVSPVEIAPVLELLASFKVSRSQQELLLYTFSKALSSVSGDDRSFTRSLYDVDRAVKNLTTPYIQQGTSIDELLRAYRTYLVRHYSARRCADNSLVLSKSIQANVISDFNKSLRLKSVKNILEISADDIKPLKVEGVVKAHLYWQSPKSSALLMKSKELRFGSGNKPLSVEERDTVDWQRKVDDFLKDLANWKPEDEETPEDYFNQKCVLLRNLIQLIPQKTAQEEVTRSLAEFLNSFDLARGSRIEWFRQARFLFKNSSVPDHIINSSDILPAVETTKNPILYLYVEAARLLTDRQP